MADSHRHCATHANILTSVRSTAGHPYRFTADGTLLYHSPLRGVHSFGAWLEPRYIVGAESLDQ